MDYVLSNEGLIHIREQIFGYLDFHTITDCRKVFKKRYGEVWDSWSKKFCLIQYFLQLGNLPVNVDDDVILKDVIPKWCKAVKKFGNMASLEDLKEVNGSLQRLFFPEAMKFDEFDCRHFPIYVAAELGHLKLMELLLLTDYDFNQRLVYKSSFYPHLGYETTPFIGACQEGNIEIVKVMINSSEKLDIDLKVRDDYGQTGFTAACWKGHTEIANLMIQSSKVLGTDLDVRGALGYTGFMSICLDGHPEIVELLMNSSKTFGIDLNARDDYGETGFMKACLKGQTEIVNLLINSSEPFGIDINARDDEGETGFMKACLKGQTEIVKLMMKSSKKFCIDLNTRDGDGGTSFMMACKNGCKETVMLMLENHKKYGINIKQETFN